MQSGECTSPRSFEEDRRTVRSRLAREVADTLDSLKAWHVVTQVALTLAVVALVAFIYTGIRQKSFSSTLYPQQTDEFGILVDAGSHGSRIHLYRWIARVSDPEHPLTTPISWPIEVYSTRVKEGISDIAQFSDRGEAEMDRRVAKHMTPLLNEVQNYLHSAGVPTIKWGLIPLYIKATAGMRDLDIEPRANVMNAIRRLLVKTTPFAFRWNWARIIAGEEEGVYGWLAVNMRKRTILSPAKSTIGALDLGGASAQITFSPVHMSVMEDFHGVTLGGQLIRLYSHSFLQYGWDDALTRLTTRMLVQNVIGGKAMPETPVSHPCLLKGELEVFQRARTLYTDATWTFKMPSPETRAYVDLTREEIASLNLTDLASREATLLGSGDYQRCKSLADDLFYNQPCFIHMCSFNGVYQPRLEDSKFMAFGQFAKIAGVLNITKGEPLSVWEERARTACTETPATNGSDAKDQATKFCWKATWAYALLTEGYGFQTNNTQIDFETQPLMQNESSEDATTEDEALSAGWAIGSMIYDINNLPWKAPLGKYKTPFVYAGLTSLLFVIVTGLLLLQLRCHTRILSSVGLTADLVSVTLEAKELTDYQAMTP